MKKKIKNEIKDKVIGAFLGGAIGDALGMSVETFSAEKIAEKYGRVTDYLTPDGHKWFDGEEAGTTTDDTQLTIAVAEAMIAFPFDMDSQAELHKEAFRDGTSGWGRSTKESVRSLCNGASWKNSATSTGLGNGVAMKVSSLGLLSPQFLFKDDADSLFVKDLTFMTHKTDL
ncbi:MAG: ADP-ribosylglycohydrolase family protein, partial [Nitrospirae bacterium]|nr:ADP-ribosylglycohydrolase family protein [Nitrospirota bacterium]